MIRYHASSILPIGSPPLRDGWVLVDGGRVVDVGRNAPPPEADRVVDLGEVAVLPGLVNAHTHLELSYLRDEIPESSQFAAWIRSIVAARRRQPDARAPNILAAVDRALTECIRAGTAVVGDISNTLVTFDPIARSSLAGVVFYELLKFRGNDAGRFVAQACQEVAHLTPTGNVRARLAAHAPYSVGPLVFDAIRDAIAREGLAPCSVHLSESAEEVEFVLSGGGPIREALETIGAWDPAWVVPGVSPVAFLDERGFLDANVLAVHGVHMTRMDLDRLAARGSWLVACPRSNARTGAGRPPIAAFYESGVRVAVGTDSLASTPDLNVFAELAGMRALAPGVPASKLLESATLEGARALGFEADYGSIAPNKLARLIAVTLPGGADDVEEYLVSGIHPEQVRWIE